MTQAVFNKTFKLNFKGVCLAYDPDEVYGPNTMGELFRPYRADYDPDTDLTTMYFEIIHPSELPALAEKKVTEVQEYERIRALFGTAG